MKCSHMDNSYLFFQGTSRLEASLPMTGFLEQLPADKSLKFLDLSAAWREAQMEKLIQDGAPSYKLVYKTH